jgi:hypothetical protein
MKIADVVILRPDSWHEMPRSITTPPGLKVLMDYSNKYEEQHKHKLNIPFSCSIQFNFYSIPLSPLHV